MSHAAPEQSYALAQLYKTSRSISTKSNQYNFSQESSADLFPASQQREKDSNCPPLSAPEALSAWEACPLTPLTGRRTRGAAAASAMSGAAATIAETGPLSPDTSCVGGEERHDAFVQRWRNQDVLPACWCSALQTRFATSMLLTPDPSCAAAAAPQVPPSCTNHSSYRSSASLAPVQQALSL